VYRTYSCTVQYRILFYLRRFNTRTCTAVHVLVYSSQTLVSYVYSCTRTGYVKELRKYHTKVLSYFRTKVHYVYSCTRTTAVTCTGCTRTLVRPIGRPGILDCFKISFRATTAVPADRAGRDTELRRRRVWTSEGSHAAREER
jgi:hypothetical protein